MILFNIKLNIIIRLDDRGKDEKAQEKQAENLAKKGIRDLRAARRGNLIEVLRRSRSST